MRLLDISFESPAQNLAFEEALLEAVESGEVRSTLRLWESAVPFVVLGTSQRFCQEVEEEGCERAGVSVLRRCSAGGCVLQGPGCLNFTLALRYADYPEMRSLRSSYSSILGRLASAFQERGLDVCHEGISDLAVDGRKVSGNSQKRRKRAFLHHGTLLYDINYELVSVCIKEPSDRPVYRGQRGHEEFIGALPLSAGELRDVVIGAFGCEPGPCVPGVKEIERMTELTAQKYCSEDWTRRR